MGIGDLSDVRKVSQTYGLVVDLVTAGEGAGEADTTRDHDLSRTSLGVNLLRDELESKKCGLK